MSGVMLWSVSPLSADQRRRGELLELDVLLPPHHPRLLLHAQPRPWRTQRVSRERTTYLTFSWEGPFGTTKSNFVSTPSSLAGRAHEKVSWMGVST